MIDVFVSRPTWVAPEFEEGLNAFLGFLESIELKPRTLGSTDYPHKSPLDEVIRIMNDCQGAIILGYPQIHVATGTIKGVPIVNPVALGTEWNHIEAALAYYQDLPLLVLHHHKVGRGIFDRGTLNSFVHEIDLSNSGWCLQESMRGALRSWKDSILAAPVQSQTAIPVDITTPICPNCSGSSKKIYLRPIPRDFIEIENATHECPQCKWSARF